MPKPRNPEQVRHLEDRVLRAPACDRVNVADRLVGFEQGHEREAKCVLHPRAPECIELALEDAQRVPHGLIAVPAQADVEQVHAERALEVADIQIHHLRAPLKRH
jgi:hypothetical protein